MKHFTLAAAVAAAVVLGFHTSAQAATYSRLTQIVSPVSPAPVTAFGETYKNGASIAAADTNGDGQDEYIIGSGPNSNPEVKIIASDGAVLKSWPAYEKKIRGGVNVAAGDLDGDGLAEVVTVPASDASAGVKIFHDGVSDGAFLAFASSYHEGASIAVLAATPNMKPRIIVGTHGLRNDEVRVFTVSGKLVRSIATNVGRSFDTGVSLAAGWSDAWNQPIIVIGAGRGSAPRVDIYGLTSKKALTSWLAFSASVKTGVTVAYRDDVVAVSQQGLGQPVVRKFTTRHVRIDETNVFESSFRGGVNIALARANGSVQVAAVPTKSNPKQATIGTKQIRVSLSKQTLTLYQNGVAISTRRISSGKWSTPTPVGTFKTRNKITKAYSKPYKLYMEWWMAITPDGKYGVHALPYWPVRVSAKYPTGRLYEGAAHIGTPVSHGCIRQTVADAKSLYNWAPVGTPVIVTR